MRFITPEQRRVYHLNYVSKPGAAFKLRARQRCAYAIRTGKITRQPCESCGAEKSEAHHDDYLRPLDVRWLCRKCHGAVHRGTGNRRAIGFCKRGHEMAGGNVRISIEDGLERRRCRQCHLDATNRRRAKTSQ